MLSSPLKVLLHGLQTGKAELSWISKNIELFVKHLLHGIKRLCDDCLDLSGVIPSFGKDERCSGMHFGQT